MEGLPIDADEVPLYEDDPDGNEFFNSQLVPHTPVPPETIKAVRVEHVILDDTYYIKQVMFIGLLYGHMTAGTPLPSVLHPNMDNQNPESEPFDFH